MRFVRYSRYGPRFVYLPKDRTDVAVVFIAAPWSLPGLESNISGDRLFAAWNAAPLVGLWRARALCFLPDLSKLEGFMSQPPPANPWGAIHYWKEGEELPTNHFPAGTQHVDFGSWKFGLHRQASTAWVRLRHLDEFSCEWQEEKACLSLRSKHSDREWQMWIDSQQPLVRSRDCAVDFSPPAGTPAGALGLPLKPAELTGLPVQVSFCRPTNASSHGFDFRRVRAAMIARMGGDGGSSNPDAGELWLDPRDEGSGGAKGNWRTRVQFAPQAAIVTTLTTEQGLTVVIRARQAALTGQTDFKTGLCRLRWEASSGSVEPNGQWDLDHDDDPVFNLEGDFEFAGVAADTTEGSVTVTPAGGFAHRMLGGLTATEFFELRAGNLLRFVAGPNALALVGDTGDVNPPSNLPASPSHPVLIHDAAGSPLLQTSWLSVPPLPPASGGATELPFFSESGEAALFEKHADLPNLLQRAYLPWAPLTSATLAPLLPWGSVTGVEEFVEHSSHTQFETTHLAAERRRRLRPGSPGPLKAATSGQFDKAPARTGVTPQGIIGSVDVDGDYVKLFFGNPDPATDQLDAEFFIEIHRDDARQFLAIQNALRADNLFLVIHGVDVEHTTTVRPGARVKLGKFAFDLDFGTVDAQAAAKGRRASALVLKYFNGRSADGRSGPTLEELVNNEAAWACKDFLAPNTTKNDLAAMFKQDGQVPPTLSDAWSKRDWQGVILLNAAAPEMPELFESLRPGMLESGPGVHHFGLNFLPIRAGDVPPTGVEPRRRGSAFALLQYRRPTNTPPDQPKPPTPGDIPPHEQGSQEAPLGSAYTFQVDSLKVEFRNSRVSSYDADVTVGFSHLFWDQVKPKNGSQQFTFQLAGSYEARTLPSGATEDVFSLRLKNPPAPTDVRPTFEFANSVLDGFTLTDAELIVTSTEPSLPTTDPITRRVTFLGMSGNLTFHQATDGQGSFDLIKLKRVSVSNFGLEFDYHPKIEAGPAAQPASFACHFRVGSIRAEFDSSGAEESLLSILPVTLKALRVAAEELIDLGKSGFVPVFNDGAKFSFAFELEVDLGFLGKLSGVGQGLKLPALLGWKHQPGQLAGAFGFGIQFPNWRSGDHFEIGLQQFLSLRAAKASLTVCRSGAGPISGIAIVLSKAQLVFFGRAWPEEADAPSCAIFLPTGSPSHKVSWALGLTGPIDAAGVTIDYLGAGYRVHPPPADDVDDLIREYRGILSNNLASNPCALLDAGSTVPNRAEDPDGWAFLADFGIKSLFRCEMALVDGKNVYGLKVTLGGTNVLGFEAFYRRVNDQLGQFAAQVQLPDWLRKIQLGVVSVRLPVIRAQVDTDGGALLDLGFPHNNDFTNSGQVELGPFLGSGGFYVGRSSLATVAMLRLEADAGGYGGISLEADAAQLGKYRALSAGIGLRVGIGRSLEIGILEGEASVSIFGSLEGAMAFTGDVSAPALFAVKGQTGILLSIWAQIHFLILTARAEVSAYALVGLEFRKVLARRTPGGPEYVHVTLPIVIYAEVGIYFRLDVQIRIGCVTVTMALEFSATWRLEETIGGYSDDPATSLMTANHGALPPGGKRKRLPRPALRQPFVWNGGYLLFPPGEKLDVYVALLACVGRPDDLDVVVAGGRTGVPCAVVQPMLAVDDGLLKCCQFLVGAALNVTNPAGATISRQQARDCNDALRATRAWKRPQVTALLDAVQAQFALAFHTMNASDTGNYAALPLWPGMSWQFHGKPRVRARRLLSPQDADAALSDGQESAFIDFLRLLTRSTLSEIERVIRDTVGLNVKAEDATMNWHDIWVQLTVEQPGA